MNIIKSIKKGESKTMEIKKRVPSVEKHAKKEGYVLRIGMIGIGIIAGAHMDAIEKVPGVKLTCIADIDNSKCEIYVKKYDVLAYKDYNTMIENQDIDLVIINLPHFLHKEAALVAAKKGINILMEKPMALSSIQCDEMIKIAKENNVKLFIGHISRYSECFRKLNNIVCKNELGRLLMIHEKRYSDYFCESRPKWFLKKALSGGGIVFNLGAHFFDHIQWVSNSKVKEIRASTFNLKADFDIEGSVHLICKLDNGVTASLILNGYSKKEEYNIEYIFTDGHIKVYPHSKYIVYKKDESYEVLLDTHNIFRNQLIDVVSCVNSNKQPKNNGEYGKSIIKCIEAAYKSSNEGSLIYII